MWLAQPGSCLSLSLLFVSIAAVLANAIAVSLEIFTASLSSPNLSFVLAGSFQTLYAGGGDGSCNQSTRTCNTDRNKRFAVPGRVRTESGGNLGGVVPGSRWEAAASFAEGCVLCVWGCEGEDGSWRCCPSWCGGIPSWKNQGSSAALLPARVFLPSVGAPGQWGEPGERGSLQSSPSPPPQRDTARHQPACWKLVSLPKPFFALGTGHHRGLHPKPAYGTRAAVFLTGGRLSPGHLQPPAPNTHLSQPFPIWHRLCQGLAASVLCPCFPPKPSVLLSPGAGGSWSAMATSTPAAPSPSQERRAGRNRQMNNLL